MGEQRYGFANICLIEEWRRFSETVQDKFIGDALRYCQKEGWPPPAFPMQYTVTPQRPGSEEDADDAGRVPFRVDCEVGDSRCVQVELRMKWIGEPGVYARQMERINADAAWIAEHHPRIATPFNPWGDRP